MATPTPHFLDLYGLVDHAGGLEVLYRLPQAPGSDASDADLDRLVLALDQVEEHVSRLRFALFVRQVLRAWPEGIAAVGLSTVSKSDPPGYMGWRVSCWKPDASGALVEEPSPDRDFVVAVANAAYEDDPGFVALAQRHLPAQGRPAPRTRAELAELALAPLDPATRAALAQAALAGRLPPPSSPPRPSRF